MTRVRIFPSDRRTGLGASELGAISGFSPWRTPLDVWIDKTEGTDPETTPQQQLGLDLEGFLVKAVGGRRNTMTWSHPDWPIVRLFATPDGFADRGRTLVEAKSVTSGFDDWAGDGIPEMYRLQAMGQLACNPNAERVVFSVLLGGRPARRVLYRDDDAEDELVEAAMRWWADYIVREVVPPPINDADRWTIARRGAEGERMSRLATPDEEAAAGDLLALREQIGELEAEAEATRLRLAELASTADLLGSGFKATWSTRVTRDYRGAWQGFNGTAAVPDEYVHESRVFNVRARKEAI